MRTAMVCGAVLGSMTIGTILGCANREPAATPGADNRPAPTRSATRPTETYTGVLEGGIMAIGGETTGWRLIGEGESGQLEVDVSAVREAAQRLSGQRVMITGQVETRDYVERGDTPVLVARRIDPAP